MPCPYREYYTDGLVMVILLYKKVKVKSLWLVAIKFHFHWILCPVGAAEGTPCFTSYLFIIFALSGHLIVHYHLYLRTFQNMGPYTLFFDQVDTKL